MQLRTRPAISSATPDTVQPTDIIYLVRPGSTIADDTDYYGTIADLFGGSVGGISFPVTGTGIDLADSFTKLEGNAYPFLQLRSKNVNGSSKELFADHQSLQLEYRGLTGTNDRELVYLEAADTGCSVLVAQTDNNVLKSSTTIDRGSVYSNFVAPTAPLVTSSFYLSSGGDDSLERMMLDLYREFEFGEYYTSRIDERKVYCSWYGPSGSNDSREFWAQVDASQAFIYLNHYDNNNLVGEFRATPAKIYLKDAAGVERFSATSVGVVDGTEYRVNGTKVVGARGSAIADPAAVAADGTISALAIGAAYSQAEVQALRDATETLRDALASTQAQLNLALAALRTHGLIAT